MGLTNFKNGITSFGNAVGPSYGGGIGNVYYVCQSASTVMYDHMRKKYGKARYDDNSPMLHLTIAAALAYTVSEREDYVIVCSDSSDYDNLASLSMAARNSHLICPGGLGSNGMGMNACRLDAGSAITAVSIAADCCEVAGFFIRGFLNSTSDIYMSGTRWHTNIHDNYVGMSASSAGGSTYGIYGPATNHMSIHHNMITNYSPAAVTGTNNAIGAMIITAGTRGIVADNIVHTGPNTTVAVGISFANTGGYCVRNYVGEDPVVSGGIADVGSLTLGISSTGSSFMIDNRINITGANKANAVSGGTTDASYICNYNSSSGGSLST